MMLIIYVVCVEESRWMNIISSTQMSGKKSITKHLSQTKHTQMSTPCFAQPLLAGGELWSKRHGENEE